MRTSQESPRWTRYFEVLAVSILLVAFLAPRPVLADNDYGNRHHRKLLKFDVAENGKRFVFDEAPVFDDGFPAYGNAFVTEGYIYPAGTLDGKNGVLPDGSPEFPRLVKGRWSCRGWFVGDGAHTVTGPWTVTTQIYDVGKIAGATSLVSDGFELADLNVPIKRAVTGGTGIYSKAGGEATQALLGFNASDGVNLRFVVRVK